MVGCAVFSHVLSPKTSVCENKMCGRKVRRMANFTKAWFNAVIEVGYWLKGVLAVAGSADRCCVASGASLFDGLSFRQVIRKMAPWAWWCLWCYRCVSVISYIREAGGWPGTRGTRSAIWLLVLTIGTTATPSVRRYVTESTYI